MTLDYIKNFDTYENPTGLLGMTTDETKLILAFPFRYQGYVQINRFVVNKDFKLINAHESKIAYLSINKDGKLLATASDKGTLIRIFKIINGEQIAELRRGTKNVNMSCISFDHNNRFIGCTSDVGTIHIFSIVDIIKSINENDYIRVNSTNDNINETQPKNPKSFLGKITGMFKFKNSYLDSERSFAKFRIPDKNSILALDIVNTFFVLTYEGKYYHATYDPKNGGDCYKIDEKDILKESINELNKEKENNYKDSIKVENKEG